MFKIKKGVQVEGQGITSWTRGILESPLRELLIIDWQLILYLDLLLRTRQQHSNQCNFFCLTSWTYKLDNAYVLIYSA